MSRSISKTPVNVQGNGVSRGSPRRRDSVARGRIGGCLAIGWFCALCLFVVAAPMAKAETVPGLDVYVHEGAEPGPTVLVTIGLDSNRDAYAPQLVRAFAEWPLKRGTFVFAVVNDAARETGDPDVRLTGAFPVEGERDEPVGPTATALWRLAEDADYVLDLRQARNVRQTQSNAYGQTIVAVRSAEAVDTADALIHAMNYSIEDRDLHWLRLRGGPIAMLARSSAAHFDAASMTVYFSTNQTEPAERERLAKLALYRLFDRLRMIEHDHPVFADLNPKPRVPDYRAMYPDRRIIGVYTGNGTGERGITHSKAAFAEDDSVVTVRFTAEEVRDGILEHFDSVIFAGGSGSGQARALGDEGSEKVRAFVEAGGGYIGICAGAYLALSGQSYGLDLINGRTKSPRWRRGQEVLPVELSEAGQQIFSGEQTVGVRYNQGPIFERDDHPDLPEYKVLAYYRDEVAKNDTPVGIQVDSPAVAAGTCGAGRVVIIGPHPESTPGADLGYFLTESKAWIFGEH